MVDENSKMKTYRKTCSALNKILDTTEIKMCAGQWDLIDYNTVTSNVLKRCKKGFLRHDDARYLEHLQRPLQEQMQQHRDPIKPTIQDVFSGLKPIPPSR